MSSGLGRILVTGANGHIGRRLCRRLAEETPAARVRALVRSPRAAATLRALPETCRPEILQVEYGRSGALFEALQGCDAIVHLVGILKETAATRYTDAHETVTWSLVRAASRSECRRLVYLSVLGADPGSPNRCLASKGRAEQIVLKSQLVATVLRVPMVLGPGELAARGLRARARAPARVVPLVRGGASLEQPIDAGDVVEAILCALQRPGLAGCALDLAGPECLSHRELVARAAALYGRRPMVLPLPLPLVRAAAGLLPWVFANPPITVPMLEVLDQDDSVDPAAACERLGLELTPLDKTLRESVGPDAPAA